MFLNSRKNKGPSTKRGATAAELEVAGTANRQPARKKPASEKEATKAQEGQWNCNVCTFLNTPAATECEVCTNPSSARKQSNQRSNPEQTTKPNSRPSPSPTKASVMSFFRSDNPNASATTPTKPEANALQWSCSACTFLNGATEARCSMCSTTRPTRHFSGGGGVSGSSGGGPRSVRDRTRNKRLYYDGNTNPEPDKPTEIKADVDSIAWIQCVNPHDRSQYGACDEEEFLRKVLDLWEVKVREQKTVSDAEKADCVQKLCREAHKQGYSTGKWMLFCGRKQVDADWVS